MPDEYEQSKDDDYNNDDNDDENNNNNHNNNTNIDNTNVDNNNNNNNDNIKRNNKKYHLQLLHPTSSAQSATLTDALFSTSSFAESTPCLLSWPEGSLEKFCSNDGVLSYGANSPILQVSNRPLLGS